MTSTESHALASRPSSTETEFSHFGIAQLASGEAPLVVPETERERVDPERVSSGGVIFTTAESMPLLEELLEAHAVQYAVLDRHVSHPAVIRPDEQHASWREEARAMLDRLVAERDLDVAMPEEYAFLAAISDDDLDRFLARAQDLLDTETSTETNWELLLTEGVKWASDVLEHVSLDPLVAAEEERESSPPPILTLEDAEFTFSKGALGGPSPLVDSPG